MQKTTEASSIVNPVQADTLTHVLPLVVPSRRLDVAAALLGIHLSDICKAAGMSNELRATYVSERRQRDRARTDLPSHLMVRLVKVLGVPFTVLWDEEALEAPVRVLGGQREREPGRTARQKIRLVAAK